MERYNQRLLIKFETFQRTDGDDEIDSDYKSCAYLVYWVYVIVTVRSDLYNHMAGVSGRYVEPLFELTDMQRNSGVANVVHDTKLKKMEVVELIN